MSAPAPSPAQANPLSTWLRNAYMGNRNNIVSAEKMPEENYGMRPGAQREVLTFGRQVSHLAFYNFLWCSQAKGPSAVWTSNGQYVLLGSQEGIFWTRADGAGRPQPLILSKNNPIPRSLNLQRLAYSLGLGMQTWTVGIEDKNGQLKAGQSERLFEGLAAEPVFSPDGQRLAYSTSGGTPGRGEARSQIFVRKFPNPSSGEARQWPISDIGAQPVWSPISHDLLYRSGDQIMAVSYTMKDDTFDAGKPRVWIANLGGTNWDLAPDGRRVAVIAPVAAPEAPKQEHALVMLENFFDELRRKVPPGK